MELWKTVEGFENYEVSNFGRMRNIITGTVRKSNIHKSGFCVVKVRNNGSLVTLRIHTLVASTFLENPNGYRMVRHIDGNKSNNIIYNLEWYTTKKVRLIKTNTLKQYACPVCDCSFESIYEQKYCSDKCRKKSKSKKKDLKRRGKLFENGKVDRDININALIKMNNNSCHICGGKCDKHDYTINKDGAFITGDNYPSIDHIKPISKGGTHTWDNVKLAHFLCNRLKSDNDFYVGTNDQYMMAM